MEKKAIDFKITHSVDTKFSYYKPVEYICSPNVPKIEFPINLNTVDMKGLNLDKKQREIIQKYGFVLSESNSPSLYDHYPNNSQIPFFITTDLCLHTFHCVIDSILVTIETEFLFDKFRDLLTQLEKKQVALYGTLSNGALKDAVKCNIAYIATMLKLLNPKIEIFKEILEIVRSELSNIQSLQIWHSAIFEYVADFSQLKPRGHYTESEKLKRYFQAMMYAGLMSFVSRDPVTDSEEIGKNHIIRALLLISTFDQEIWDLWEEINRVITFFFGYSDNITPKELQDLWKTEIAIVGDNLSDQSVVNHFLNKFEELRSPKIHSMIVFEEPAKKIRSFSLFGQKTIPDSFIFQQLVYSALPTRFMVKGMDIFSVFGNNRATELQKQEEEKYKGYKEQIQKLQDYYSKLNDNDWTESLYTLWIYTLLSLLKPLPDGYPSFMRTTAWHDKSLMSSHGTWTELRYDSILYVKQAYTEFLGVTYHPPPPPPAEGYVEPNPEFYGRLFSMVQYLKNGFDRLDLPVLEYMDSDLRYKSLLAYKLSQFSDILVKLKDISCKELECKPLYKEDNEFIRCVSGRLSMLTERKTPLIVTDVFTDSYVGGIVLEEGLGFPYIIHVIVQDHEGNLRLTRGAMYSQYEFTVQLSNRLDKEDWAKILSENPPDFHPWIKYLISDEKHKAKMYQNPVQIPQREEPWKLNPKSWFGVDLTDKKRMSRTVHSIDNVVVYKLNEKTIEFEKITRDKLHPKEILVPNSVLLFLDPMYFKAWLWIGSKTTSQMKDFGAKLAPGVKNQHGTPMRLIKIDDGMEPERFKMFLDIMDEKMKKDGDKEDDDDEDDGKSMNIEWFD